MAVVLTKRKREKAVNVSLFTVGHVFVGFVERVGSGIRNGEFATLFFCYLWKIISHLQYFFGFSFFKIIEYNRSLRGLLSMLWVLGGFPIQTVAAVENVSI